MYRYNTRLQAKKAQQAQQAQQVTQQAQQAQQATQVVEAPKATLECADLKAILARPFWNPEF